MKEALSWAWLMKERQKGERSTAPLSLPENLAAFQAAVRYSYNLMDFKTREAAKDDEPRFFLNNMAGII